MFELLSEKYSLLPSPPPLSLSPLLLSRFYMYLSPPPHLLTLFSPNTQRSSAMGSREGTPSRPNEGDNLSIDSGDLLGATPPGSPSRSRRKYPAMALSAAQRERQEGSGSNVPSALNKTHLGEATDGGFFSEKIHRTIHEKCYINGL